MSNQKGKKLNPKGQNKKPEALQMFSLTQVKIQNSLCQLSD